MAHRPLSYGHDQKARTGGPSTINMSPHMPPSNGLKSRATHAPQRGQGGGSSSKPQGPEMATFVEHTKKDSKGNLITKRYQRGDLLGKGGFAKCYQVTDVDSREQLACKVIAKASLTKARHKQKLQSEIKIHRAQNHAHVVRFEDVFEDKDNVYIIMELCTNHTMLEVVKRKKRLSESETRRFMLQIIDGVKHLHENNVIHRDLKLGNIFLGAGDTVKIGDFGLACKLAYDGERKKTLCGTPNYIAPEVLESKNGHSFEVDTWSIGVILYTCLVGKPPFETQDVKSTYRLIKANSYSFPSSVHVPEKGKALIRKILQHRPEMRPSLGEILSDPFLSPNKPVDAHLPPGGGKLKEMLQDALNFSSADQAHQGGKGEAERPPLHPVNTNSDGSAPTSARTVVASPGSKRSTNRTGSAFSNANENANSALERNISSASSTMTSGLPSSRSTGPPSASASAAASAAGTERVPIGSVPGSLLSRRSNISNPSPIAASVVAPAAVPAASAHGGAAPAATLDLVGSTRARAPSRPSSALLRAASPRSSKTTPAVAAAPKEAAESKPASRAGSSLCDALSSASTATSAPSSAAGSTRSAAELKRKEEASAPAGAPKGGLGDKEDFGTLNHMHEWLSEAFSEGYKAPKAGGAYPLPAVWVGGWVDYSKKYGLGYTLNDGRYGVFFNDATKILLGGNQDSFHYMERHKSPDGSKYDVPQAGSISSHGPELNKKVTLLDHFRNYLDDNKGEREPPVAPKGGGEGEFVYVRKWMRTRHSVIFRLSNNNFQVNFFDETEVMVWADRKLVTFKAKKKPRATYDAGQVLASPEVTKRVRYVRDILQQLCATMA